MADRKPLLPQHRYSLGQAKIAFPSVGQPPASSSPSTTNVGGSAGRSSSAEGMGAMSPPPERKPGLPKVSRECLWSEVKCYGRHIVPVILVNLLLIAVFLSVYFTR